MIKEIIPAITPEHITDIQLLKDGLDIFLDYLVEHSSITEDIKNVFNSNHVPIYEEFVKIYLNNIYNVLSKSDHNEKLYMKLKDMYSASGENLDDIDLDIDIIGLLKKEYILTHKDYKASKGTSKAMEYIYNIIIESGIQVDFLEDNEGQFRYYENGNLFEYNIEGTMVKELYEHFVKPLSHPVGWAYFYQRIFYLSFVDYFDLEFIYTIRSMEVRCMNGDSFEKDDYRTNISHLGLPLVVDNTVTFISTEYIGLAKVKRITVYFKSGETLISLEEPRSLILYDKNGLEKINYNNYEGNCGLFLDFDVVMKTTVKDEIDFSLSSMLASTTGKCNVIGAENVFIGSFVVGDRLVNKDVSVTYQSAVGMFSGNYINEYVAPKEDIYWDLTNYNFDDYLFNLDSNLNGAGQVYVDYTSFKVDDASFFVDMEIEEIVEEVIPPYNTLFDYPMYDDTNEVRIFAVGGESGKTCFDEYEWYQELVKIPNPHITFEDDLNDPKLWDYRGLKFEEFTFDGEYVGEEFSINYDDNTWDTDIYLDFFQFDGKYVGGGFTSY